MGFDYNPFTGNFDLTGGGVGSSITVNIPATTSSDVDTNALADFRGLKYFITAWSTTRAKSLEMNVINDNSALRDTVSNKIGPGLPLQVDAIISGSDAILRITNNNAFAIDVEVLKFTTGG